MKWQYPFKETILENPIMVQDLKGHCDFPKPAPGKPATKSDASA